MAKYDVYIYTPVEDPNLEMTRIRPETAAVADRLDAFREIERTYTPPAGRPGGGALPELPHPLVPAEVPHRHGRARLHRQPHAARPVA